MKDHIESLNIADLTDVLPIYYPEIYEPDIITSDISINGRIYVMPKIVTSTYQERMCLIVDREMYDQAGKPDIKNIQDIIKLYEFGVMHKDSNGLNFLRIDKKFSFEFYTLLELYCQESGYQISSEE